MTSESTITDVEKKRYNIISYMFECGNTRMNTRCHASSGLSLSLAAKLRLSILTTASAAVIYHRCSCFLEKSDFDQYVRMRFARLLVDTLV